MTTGTTAGGETCELDNFQRVSVLAEALPYLQRFAGQTIVVKYGGHAMTNSDRAEEFASDMALLQSLGIRVVVRFQNALRHG